MKIHSRTQQVSIASAKIRLALLALQEEYGLTDIEMVQVLTESQQNVLKYMLRRERHPKQPDKAADEE